jgi:glutathionylspermidine synthase
MKREKFFFRTDYLKRLQEYGFDYHTVDDIPYWQEKAGYKFTSDEVEKLYAASKELSEMCLAAVQHVIDNNLFAKLKIPENCVALIKKSWNRDDFTFYGRFDLAMKDGQIKMYEYNADTPTSFLEAGLVQWYWKEDRKLKDQFNSIHESAIEQWKYLKEKENPKKIYFTCVRESLEDFRNTEYIMDLAKQAGHEVEFLFIDEVGCDGDYFYDADDNVIEYMFKLYPWEFMVHEDFGEALLKDNVRLIEPAWKMILSNKGILPILWELYPNHPLLLESKFEPLEGKGYVKKPIFSREGANVTLVDESGKTVQEKDGEYGEEGHIYQELFTLPEIGGYRPVIGSWIVGAEPVGVGIREDEKLITGNTSFFVPNYFE